MLLFSNCQQMCCAAVLLLFNGCQSANRGRTERKSPALARHIPLHSPDTCL
jgi:hypothetical protein